MWKRPKLSTRTTWTFSVCTHAACCECVFGYYNAKLWKQLKLSIRSALFSAHRSFVCASVCCCHVCFAKSQNSIVSFPRVAATFVNGGCERTVNWMAQNESEKTIVAGYELVWTGPPWHKHAHTSRGEYKCKRISVDWTTEYDTLCNCRINSISQSCWGWMRPQLADSKTQWNVDESTVFDPHNCRRHQFAHAMALFIPILANRCSREPPLVILIVFNNMPAKSAAPVQWHYKISAIFWSDSLRAISRFSQAHCVRDNFHSSRI